MCAASVGNVRDRLGAGGNCVPPSWGVSAVASGRAGAAVASGVCGRRAEGWGSGAVGAARAAIAAGLRGSGSRREPPGAGAAEDRSQSSLQRVAEQQFGEKSRFSRFFGGGVCDRRVVAGDTAGVGGAWDRSLWPAAAGSDRVLPPCRSCWSARRRRPWRELRGKSGREEEQREPKTEGGERKALWAMGPPCRSSCGHTRTSVLDGTVVGDLPVTRVRSGLLPRCPGVRLSAESGGPVRRARTTVSALGQSRAPVSGAAGGAGRNPL